MFFFTTSGKDQVLFTPLNLLHRSADAMGTCRAGGGNGIVESANAEMRGQAGGNGPWIPYFWEMVVMKESIFFSGFSVNRGETMW